MTPAGIAKEAGTWQGNVLEHVLNATADLGGPTFHVIAKPPEIAPP